MRFASGVRRFPAVKTEEAEPAHLQAAGPADGKGIRTPRSSRDVLCYKNTSALSGGSGTLNAMSPFASSCAEITNGLPTASNEKGKCEWITTVWRTANGLAKSIEAEASTDQIYVLVRIPHRLRAAEFMRDSKGKAHG